MVENLAHIYSQEPVGARLHLLISVGDLWSLETGFSEESVLSEVERLMLGYHHKGHITTYAPQGEPRSSTITNVQTTDNTGTRPRTTGGIPNQNVEYNTGRRHECSVIHFIH